MSLDDQKTKYRALDDWFRTPQGTHVANDFALHVALVADMLYGSTVLQLGNCGNNTALSRLPFKRKWVVSPCLDAMGTHVISSVKSVPFARHSVDCVFAPFAMEIVGWDNSPLDEIDRVLKPMGHLILFGMNPFSLWGLALRAGFINRLGNRGISLISPLLLQQRLLQRGYVQRVFESFYYIPPVRDLKWIRRFEFLNQMGKMLSPMPPGFYYLMMQKHEPCSSGLIRRVNTRRIHIAAEPVWARRALRTTHPN
ncbi:MAG: hypothetical protein B7X00_01200 [Legionella sp. 21-45-4]|nr:MAG: hypothetical protein B7X00_01200 [Legionella sp. 21-45-4]